MNYTLGKVPEAGKYGCDAKDRVHVSHGRTAILSESNNSSWKKLIYPVYFCDFPLQWNN